MEAVSDTSEVSLKRPLDSCGYWLQKRKRYCRTKPMEGLEYCPSHLSRASQEVVLKTVEDVLALSENMDNGETLPGVSESNSTEMGMCSTNAIDVLSSCDKLSSEMQQHESRISSRPPPFLDRCHFWLERKRRYCKARVSGTRHFCVEHSVSTGVESTRVRISCPNDPKHSCYADQLDRHLKKCNARHDLRPVCFVEKINSGEWEGDTTEDLKVGIHDIEISELNSIIEIVKALHQENGRITSSILSHGALKDEIEKSANGAAALKHLHQQSSLVGNLDSLGLLKDCCNYLEFGAGKGGLSHWIQLANKDNHNTKYLLIDRSSVRYKMDSYHKGEDQGPNFERLKIDIENLDLSKVTSLSSNSWPLVGTGKHLCGAATDLMLRCLVNADNNSKSAHHCAVDGMLVALCCHHRCDWKAYVGKDWFTAHGLGPRQFRLITSMSAWATCGMRHVAGTDSTEGLKYVSDTEKLTSYYHPRYGKLLPEERENIGFQCKQVIDCGRLHYLMTHGYEAKILCYVDRSLTLENTALTAVCTDLTKKAVKSPKEGISVDSL